MKSQALIDAFEVLAEAPDGIPRLRELVLQLAVRGKLVSQDPGDEPASVSLDRVAQERSKLVRDKRIKKAKPSSPISPDEIPYETPSGWRWGRLGDVANIASNLVKPDSHPDAPHVAPNSIEKMTGKLLGYRSVQEDGVTSNKHLFFPGQILYSKIRPNLSKVVTVDFGGLCSADMYPIDPWIDRDYLHRYMLSYPFRRQVVSDDNRLAMPKVNQQQLSVVLVPVPPLAEQHRIVAKVDELMALLDRLEAARNAREATRVALRDSALAALRDADSPEEVNVAWQRIAERMDDLFTDPADVEPLRQTVLQLAVRGRLVPQDPEDEPARVLLEATAKESKRVGALRKLRRPKQLPELATVPKPYELPNGWQWCRFAEIGEIARGRSKHRPRNDPALYVDGTIPMVQTGDVARARPEVATCSAHYNERGLAQSRLWPAGTMCITIAANIADTGLLAFDACFPDSVVGFTPFLPLTDAQYFEYFLRTVQSSLDAFAPSTAQKNINLAILDEVLIPLPPLKEVRRVVAKVDHLMTKLDQLEQHLADKRAAHDAFAAAVVHHLDG